MSNSNPKKLPNTGELRDEDLTHILKQLHEEKATGRLVLRSKNAAKLIYLKEGHIRFASSNVRGDRLGEILLSMGKINTEQLRQSVDLIKKTGQQQGAILVQAGYLTARELFDGLKEQVREIIYSVFLWEEGRYQFIPEEPSPHAIILQLDMVQLLSEVLRRLEEQPR